MWKFKKSNFLFFKKLLMIKEYLHYSYDFRIVYKILDYYNTIEEENNKFEYVYKNVTYINFDIYLSRIITKINLNIIALSVDKLINTNKKILQYDTLIFDKFIYIISIAVRHNINTTINEKIINKYIPKIIALGNKYDIINACLLSYNISINDQKIKIKFDYYDGLIECLNLSPRWDENILYFHNKQLINKFDLKDIFTKVTKHLFQKNDDDSYNIIIDLFDNKSDFIISECY